MLLLAFFLLAVSPLSFAQQLFTLKSFGGGDTKINAAAPYAIYVSASSDSETNSGLLLPFQVTGDAYISTTLSDADMNQLKGYLYVTTQKQLENKDGFHVYDVSVNEKIQRSAAFPDTTMVFLNSNFDTNPWQSTTISFRQQESDSSAFIYKGFPTDDVEKDSTQIFSNPLKTANGNTVFFPSVEQFSLSLGAFYIKTHKVINFDIQPKYTDLDGSQTSAVTTTGLFMKPFNAVDRKITVQTLRDPAYNGTFGANLVGSVPDKSNVGVQENVDNVSTSVKVFTPTDQIMGFSSAFIGQNFTIESAGTTAGEFFVQFYVIQGSQYVGTTLSGRQTTARGIETTTKSSTMATFLGSVFIPILGSRLL